MYNLHYIFLKIKNILCMNNMGFFMSNFNRIRISHILHIVETYS